MAKASGIERVYEFSTQEGPAQGLDDMVQKPGHAFAVLHGDGDCLEPLGLFFVFYLRLFLSRIQLPSA